MPWIESHQELRNHPKLMAACRRLEIAAPQMAGHLHFLWWWAMDYAMDGDLSRYDQDQIADASGWRGDAKTFCQALAEVGFLDREKDGYKIHDWFDFCGEIIKKRLIRKDEKRRNSAEIGGRFLPKSAEVPPTIPDRTRPNRTKPTSGAVAPKAGGPEKAYLIPDKVKDPAGRLVIGYKVLKGFAKDDRSWDKIHFPRGRKCAGQIMEICGDFDSAAKCMDELSEQFEKKALDWTFETIVKHAHEWKRKRGIKIADSQNSKGVHHDSKSVVGISPQGGRGGGLVPAASTLAGIRGLPDTERAAAGVDRVGDTRDGSPV